MSGLYGYRWQKARERFLAEHPICQCPLCDEGRIKVTPATVVDHKIPHKGDEELFWDQSNWQALNKHCHDSWKQKVERSGNAGTDLNGNPINPNHHWNK